MIKLKYYAYTTAAVLLAIAASGCFFGGDNPT